MRHAARRYSFALCGALSLASCYRGSARDAAPSALAADHDWVRVDVPEVRQVGSSDCGAAALASVLGYWHRPVSLAEMSRALETGSGGASAGALEHYARQRGLSAYVFYASVADLRHELAARRPVIVGVIKPYSPKRGVSHYEVVTGYDPVRERVLTFDPAHGLRENSLAGFLAEWEPTRRLALVVLG
jgi:ABC-type bacteriocin/lantibiotic exporter with double-glycine peptidase domain